MLREPRLVEKAPVLRKSPGKGRFRLVKLEERIAPKHAGRKHGGHGSFA
jgi:hypothetical protein